MNSLLNAKDRDLSGRPIQNFDIQKRPGAASVANALLYGLLFVVPAAYAQVIGQTPAQSIDEGLRRQEERAQELRQLIQPKADALQPQAPVSISAKLPVESPCFTIREIQLVGPDAVRFGWLTDAAQSYLGQCAGVAGLSQIAAALDAHLIELGYVTSRVTLPRQNLREGLLIINLHVGRVAAVAMFNAGEKNAPDKAWGTWRNAFPVGQGEVLNVRDLEQGVEQMKRLPSQAVVTELEPGEEPDTSNVKILRKAGEVSERLRGGATLDNSGNGPLGKTQFAGYLIFDNPFGLNDIISVSANSNVENLQAKHRSQSFSFNYSIPWGYNTFTFSQSQSRYAQLVQGTTVQFLSSGRSENSEFRWHRTIVRTDVAKAGLYGAVSTRRANSFLDDVELIVQRRRTTNLEVGLTYRQLFGDASLDMEVGYRTGVPWQNAQEDLPSAGNGGLTLRPDIVVLSGAFSKPFKLGERPLQYTVSWRGQATHATTLSVDQIAIGSRYSVRGFDGESVLLAESGYFVRNELSTPLSLLESINTSAYAGMDFGRVWGPSAAALVGNKLAGAALGLRGQWRRLQFDFALATPLYKPSGFRTQPWNAYFSATYAF